MSNEVHNVQGDNIQTISKRNFSPSIEGPVQGSIQGSFNRTVHVHTSGRSITRGNKNARRRRPKKTKRNPSEEPSDETHSFCRSWPFIIFLFGILTSLVVGAITSYKSYFPKPDDTLSRPTFIRSPEGLPWDGQMLQIFTLHSSKNSCHFPSPVLPRHHVVRKDYEQKIRQHLTARSTDSQSVLLLWGLGSSGKSCLSIRAMKIASDVGYDCVVWVDVGQSQPTRVLRRLGDALSIVTTAETDDKTLVAKIVGKWKAGNEKILVVLDDLQDDTLLNLFAGHISHFLISSRDQRIGWHSLIKENARELLEVKGLKEDESETLVSNILGDEEFAKLSSDAKMFHEVKSLCRQAHHMPLTVNFIASILKEDYDNWRTKGVTYVTDLRQELDNLRNTSAKDKDSIRPTGTDYPYLSVYDAIKYSIRRLSEELMEKFHLLAVFERGERLLSVTLSRVWHCKSKIDADRILKVFYRKTLITKGSYSSVFGHHEYKLHDLVYDILFNMTATEKYADAVISSYQSALRNEGVDRSDEFFYTKFVGFCVRFGRLDMAADCLSRLSLLVDRIGYYSTTNIFSDFALVKAKLRDDTKLQAYSDIVKRSLSVFFSRKDATALARVALLRSNDEIFREALNFSADRSDEVFYQFRNPPEVVMVDQAIVVPIKGHGNTNLLQDYEEENNRLLIVEENRAVLRNVQNGKVMAVSDGDLGEVHFIRYVSGSQSLCIAVTRDKLIFVDLLRSNSSHPPLRFSPRKGSEVQLKGIFKAAGMENETLWVVAYKAPDPHFETERFFFQGQVFSDSHNYGELYVSQYKIGKRKFREVANLRSTVAKSLFRDIQDVELEVSKCGRFAAVSLQSPNMPGCRPLEYFSLTSWAQMKRQSICVKFKIVDVLSDGKLVLSRSDYPLNRFSLLKVAADKQDEVLAYVIDSSVFRMDSEKYLIVNQLSGRCHVVPGNVSHMQLLYPFVSLPGKSLLALRKKKLFYVLPSERTIHMYNLNPSSNFSPISALTQSEIQDIQWLQWSKTSNNFLVATCNKTSNVMKLKILGRHVLLTATVDNDLCPTAFMSGILNSKSAFGQRSLFFSVAQQHLKIAVFGELGSEVTEWNVEDHTNHVQQRGTFPSTHTVVAICHSDEKSDLYVVVSVWYRYYLYRVEENETILCPVEFQPMNPMSKTGYLYVHDSTRSVLFQSSSNILQVRSFGKSYDSLTIRDSCNFSVIGSRVFVQMCSGRMDVWDLLQKQNLFRKQKIFEDKKMKITDYFVDSSGRRLLFLLRKFNYVELRLVEEKVDRWMQWPLYTTDRFERICFWSGRTALLLGGNEIVSVKIGPQSRKLKNATAIVTGAWLGLGHIRNCYSSFDGRTLTVMVQRGGHRFEKVIIIDKIEVLV